MSIQSSLVFVVGLVVAIAGCREDSAKVTADAMSADAMSVDAQPAADTLRIVTWNVGCLREGETEVFCNTGNARTQEHVDALRMHAEALDADVVFLQEVENVAAVEQIFPGWTIQTFGKNSQHVAIAISPTSKATVSNVQEVSALQTTTFHRPGLDATLRYRDADVRVLAVHLASGCHTDAFDSTDPVCVTLRTQLLALSSWIEEREAADDVYMLVGDFNREMEGEEGFEEALQRAATSDLYRSTEGVGATCWHHHPDAPHFNSYIDHHILSAGVSRDWGMPSFDEYTFPETYPLAWKYVSDHCPLVLTFP